MKNLKILIIKKRKFSEGPRCLPTSLRVLEWRGYPSHCLPSDFQPGNLVICMLPRSCITSIELKKFVNLRVLNFNNCKFLTHIPDVSGLLNLKELSFRKCVNLVTVHNSIGFLDKLRLLLASGCCKLGSFPPIKLISLEYLDFSRCSSLWNFPEILGKMENIREVWLDDTAIKELPFSFQYLTGLQYLSLNECGVIQLPSSILMMPKLSRIDACDCKGLKWVKREKDEEKVGSIFSSKVTTPDFPSSDLCDDFFSVGFTRLAHLSYLDLSENNLTFIPECIKEFQSLEHVNVNNCKHLQEVRGVPPNLQIFHARKCRSLTSSSSSMLINQESLSARMYQFYLSGTCIAKWFDHQRRGSYARSEHRERHLQSGYSNKRSISRYELILKRLAK